MWSAADDEFFDSLDDETDAMAGVEFL